MLRRNGPFDRIKAKYVRVAARKSVANRPRKDTDRIDVVAASWEQVKCQPAKKNDAEVTGLSFIFHLIAT